MQCGSSLNSTIKRQYFINKNIMVDALGLANLFQKKVLTYEGYEIVMQFHSWNWMPETIASDVGGQVKEQT